MAPLSLTEALNRRYPHLALEGRCPAGFRCFPAAPHLIQINVSSADHTVLVHYTSGSPTEIYQPHSRCWNWPSSICCSNSSVNFLLKLATHPKSGQILSVTCVCTCRWGWSLLCWWTVVSLSCFRVAGWLRIWEAAASLAPSRGTSPPTSANATQKFVLPDWAEETSPHPKRWPSTDSLLKRCVTLYGTLWGLKNGPKPNLFIHQPPGQNPDFLPGLITPHFDE